MTSGFSADSSRLPAGTSLSHLADQIGRLGELGTKEEALDLDDLDRLITGESTSIRTEVARGVSMASPSSSSRPLDPAWVHAKVDANSRNAIICLHCGKKIGGGGITRFKHHLAGISGQVESCRKVPDSVKRQIIQQIDEKGKNEERKYETREIRDLRVGDSSHDILSAEGGSGSQFRPSKKRRTGYFPPLPKTGSEPSSGAFMASEDMVQHGMDGAEAPIDLLHEARIAMARWWYDADVPFSASKSPFYQPMLEAIASAGLGFRGPSYHDLRKPLLQHIAEDIHEYLNDLKREWSVRGCSIIADRQKDNGEGSIINFLVYCPRGTMFLKSIDTSTERADLLEIFDQVIREVGPENIVQFITDVDPGYKASVKVLEERYGTFIWSPCAAHCIDLMLENFADPRYFPKIDETLGKARKITKFVYNHAWALSLMRTEFTNGRDLCRPSISRFATHFLSLQCIVKFEKELRQMVASNKWVKSTCAKGGVGKDVTTIIWKDADFWAQCKHVVKVTGPLLRVLRLVDSNENPSMGYLYDAMEKAKESIRARMMHKSCLYGPYVRVIDARMEKQLHSPLHGAGCFFNPGIYFSPSFKMQSYAFRGLMKTIASLVPDVEVQDKIFLQLEEYKKSTGDFGLPIAVRQRQKLNPVAWWDNFGNGTLELQSLAVRVLSQCCSATGCERNWDIFKYLHSMKLSRLEHSRLHDIVFVRYNLKLRERNMHKLKDTVDPISLDNINVLDEWVSEHPSLLCRDDLNWESVDAPFAEPTSDDEELMLLAKMRMHQWQDFPGRQQMICTALNQIKTPTCMSPKTVNLSLYHFTQVECTKTHQGINIKRTNQTAKLPTAQLVGLYLADSLGIENSFDVIPFLQHVMAFSIKQL